jgi:hypothetical protein
MFKLIRDIDVSPIFTIFLLDFETEPEVLYFLVYIFVNFPMDCIIWYLIIVYYIIPMYCSGSFVYLILLYLPSSAGIFQNIYYE